MQDLEKGRSQGNKIDMFVALKLLLVNYIPSSTGNSRRGLN